jgi:hypothetical protein
MTSSQTARYYIDIMDRYEEAEEDDFEDTTREERYWMDKSYVMAAILLEKSGYVRQGRA